MGDLKILHVIPSVAVRYGGPSNAIGPMCSSVATLGFETLIATTDADGPRRLDVPIGERTTWNGVPAIFFPRDCSEAYKYSHALGRWLARHVGDFAVVHIHAVLSYAPLVAARACRQRGVPYVVRPLGTIDPWSLQQKPLRKKLCLALGGRRMLTKAAAIHYTSLEEKKRAEQTLRLANGVVIPLGIDSNTIWEPPAADPQRSTDPYVLVLSRLHPKKNLESLIEAFARIAVQNGASDSWRLVLAGSGERPYVDSLKRLVDRHGMQHRVSFAGWVEGDSKQRLLRNASLFASPSFQENFGLSLVEAMAAGVPALVSRQVNLADAVDVARAGWIVDTDEASLYAGFAEALASASERESRGRAARDLARSLVWSRIAPQLAQLYRDVITTNSAHAVAGPPSGAPVDARSR